MHGIKWRPTLTSVMVLNLVYKSFQAAVITVDPLMTRNRPSFIVCTTSTHLTKGVNFYTDNDISKGSCLFAGNPSSCSSTIPGYNVTQNVTTRTTTLHIDSVDCTRETGSWYCAHGNDDTSSSTYIGCNTTRYAPTITAVPNNKGVGENTQININCGGGSSPGNPLPRYRWTGPDGYSRDQAVLDRTVTRTEGGQYTCTATNTVGSDTATVNINVQYAPVITSVPQNKNVTEKTSPNIDCSSNITPGNPSSTSYRWTGPGGYRRDQVVLVRTVTRTQGGQYTCTASNIAGSDTAQVNINVQYLDRPVFSLDKSEVMENDTVNLDCSVDSNPVVEMTIKNIDNDTTVAQMKASNLPYTIQKAQCLHNGTYVCSAENKKIGVNYKTERPLNVLCSPRPDNRQPYVETIKTGLGEVASLVTDAVSNPAPTFRWFKYINAQLIPIPTSTIHTIVTSEQQSVLQITVSHNRDYGRYAALVENNLGKLETLFTLSPISSPRSPDEMTVDNKTATTVSLRWKSNDNGGSEQTFNVEYQTAGNDWRLWKEGILDPGKGKWLNTVIRNLVPDTQYYFQVYSQNLYGRSDKVVREDRTPVLEVTENFIPTSDCLGLGVGIGIAASTPVIIGLMIALVVFVRRRPQKRKGGSVYQDTQRQMRNLGNQDPPSAYTDLQRDNQIGNEYEKIDVPREVTGSTTEYENTDHL